MLPLILLALSGCDFSAATDVRVGDTATDSGASSDDGSDGTHGGGGDGGDGGDGDDPAATDQDGDGFTEADGDCDDTDSTISPEATDGCDGRDDDCDGTIDEEAWRDDPYEPNDDVAWPGGSWHDDGSHSLEASLHADADVDRYRFSMDDSSWSLFSIDVGLSGIPDGAVYVISVVNVTTGETYGVEEGAGSLSVSVDDTVFNDEGGTWEIAVWSRSGADCARTYLLSVGFSG